MKYGKWLLYACCIVREIVVAFCLHCLETFRISLYAVHQIENWNINILLHEVTGRATRWHEGAQVLMVMEFKHFHGFCVQGKALRFRLHKVVLHYLKS